MVDIVYGLLRTETFRLQEEGIRLQAAEDYTEKMIMPFLAYLQEQYGAEALAEASSLFLEDLHLSEWLCMLSCIPILGHIVIVMILLLIDDERFLRLEYIQYRVLTMETKEG